MKKFLIVALAVMSCWTVSNAKVNVVKTIHTTTSGELIRWPVGWLMPCVLKYPC